MAAREEGGTFSLNTAETGSSSAKFKLAAAAQWTGTFPCPRSSRALVLTHNYLNSSPSIRDPLLSFWMPLLIKNNKLTARSTGYPSSKWSQRTPPRGNKHRIKLIMSSFCIFNSGYLLLPQFWGKGSKRAYSQQTNLISLPSAKLIKSLTPCKKYSLRYSSTTEEHVRKFLSKQKKLAQRQNS